MSTTISSSRPRASRMDQATRSEHDVPALLTVQPKRGRDRQTGRSVSERSSPAVRGRPPERDPHRTGPVTMPAGSDACGNKCGSLPAPAHEPAPRQTRASQFVDRGPSGVICARALLCRGAGVAAVLAGGPIRGSLQAHPTVPRMAERSPEPSPGSLPVPTNSRSVCGPVGAPFTAGKAQARGPRVNGFDAQAFRRRRRRRRLPPPRLHTDR